MSWQVCILRSFLRSPAMKKAGLPRETGLCLSEFGWKTKKCHLPQGQMTLCYEILCSASAKLRNYGFIIAGFQSGVKESGNICFSICYESEETTYRNLQTDSRPLPCHEKRRSGYSSIPSLSRNCATVMHFGCSISRLRKSLSPVRITSTSDTMAAFKIGWSFASRISFSAWSTAGINS